MSEDSTTCLWKVTVPFGTVEEKVILTLEGKFKLITKNTNSSIRYGLRTHMQNDCLVFTAPYGYFGQLVIFIHFLSLLFRLTTYLLGTKTSTKKQIMAQNKPKKTKTPINHWSQFVISSPRDYRTYAETFKRHGRQTGRRIKLILTRLDANVSTSRSSV